MQCQVVSRLSCQTSCRARSTVALSRPVNLIERDLISFRRMTEADLSLLERWLAADHVMRW